ncbi:MAG: 4-hydroxy-tetrahydrodipicolinate synthase [Alphaproteobacteria bacterium]|nr:4-hydroxy-tetrahydrodipicolinate synthase [Chthoniobacterales bacterium]MBY0463129.1 4-hydroxy-tetrahydrodipicolinate synthase [Alphaproteobacteria bacterium]
MNKNFPSFAGANTAIVTPFRDGKVDEEAFAKLIEFQIAANVRGILPTGTTGEAPTLTPEEQLSVIELTIKTVNKRALVIAGTGSNSTAKTIEMTQKAERLGADAALIVVPYYNKPSPEGLYRHFKEVAASVKIPIVPYDNPTRCGIEMPISIILRLAADCPNIVALKDSVGNIDRIHQLKAALPLHFELLSGDDIFTLPLLKAGGVGVFSVASNFIPSKIAQLVSLFAAGKAEQAEALHAHLTPFFKNIFIESNPVPIKTALAMKGMIKEEFRLPLVELTKEHRAILAKTVEELGCF